MFLHVTEVRLTKDYELQVTFSDGVVKEVDLAGELYGEIFEPLKDLRGIQTGQGQQRHEHD
jgi:uncharacterized protein DUF2442